LDLQHIVKLIAFSLPLLLTLLSEAADKGRAERHSYTDTIAPLAERYCYSCHGHGKHKGDVTLDKYKDESAALTDRKTWERVLKVVQDHEMPPENKPQPTEQEREMITKWIEERVLGCDCEHPDPGRVTIRRLNRAEYNNTIRDLLGVQFQPADDFPADDSGYGFDNIGDVLSMPPILIEKYLAAAERVLDSALLLRPPPPPSHEHFPVNALEVGYNAKQRGDGWAALNSIEEDDVAANFVVQREGEYAVRVRAYAKQEGPAPIKLAFMLDQQVIKLLDIETNVAAPQIYEARVPTPAGRNRCTRSSSTNVCRHLRWSSRCATNPPSGNVLFRRSTA
jgi:hypothetical protein